jgi:hypothetical protein
MNENEREKKNKERKEKRGGLQVSILHVYTPFSSRRKRKAMQK